MAGKPAQERRSIPSWNNKRCAIHSRPIWISSGRDTIEAKEATSAFAGWLFRLLTKSTIKIVLYHEHFYRFSERLR